MKVAIVGCGLVGKSWAACFARAGWSVSLYDAAESQARAAAAFVEKVVGSAPPRSGIDGGNCRVAADLGQAVADANFVQESVAERLGVKAQIFETLDQLAPPDAILASSTSAIMPSTFMEGLKGRGRGLVAHPFNPPHLIPLVEVAPSQWTSEAAVGQTFEIMTSIGQQPVLIKREIEGFVGNRLQAAVINEAMSLVALGIISPADLDRCMISGLGRRWAFQGPFETMDLNAPQGFADYAAKFGASYQQLGTTLRVAAPWDARAAGAIEEWRRSVLPLAEIASAQSRRDQLLESLGGWLRSVAAGGEVQ